MERFLFFLGFLIFFLSAIFFVMIFFTEYEGIAMILSIFGMLNASIAIGVAEILSRTKKYINN